MVGALGLLAEAIQADVDDSDQVQHFAERMELESARLSNLIGDIVELSRLQGDDFEMVFEPVRLSEVVDLAVDAVASAAESKNIVIVPAESIDVVVEGTKSQLVAALRNLVANAIQHTPVGSPIEVAVGYVSPDPASQATAPDAHAGDLGASAGPVLNHAHHHVLQGAGIRAGHGR